MVRSIGPANTLKISQLCNFYMLWCTKWINIIGFATYSCIKWFLVFNNGTTIHRDIDVYKKCQVRNVVSRGKAKNRVACSAPMISMIITIECDPINFPCS